MTEKIMETKKCVNCKTEFSVTDKDLEFYDKVSLIFGGKKYAIPDPIHCPKCRQQRRLAFRNERKLYRRKCDATGKTMISIYSQDKPYTVFDPKIWWSDSRNALDYGRKVSAYTSLFEQLNDLFLEVPLLGLIGANNENSDYVNLTADSKNCYMVVESSNNEDCYYSYWIQKCKKCCDVSFSHGCENCYDLDNCHDCYSLQMSIDCTQCSDSLLLKNCVGCSYCFGSINLRNQKYCIFNQQVSKEEYHNFIDTLYTDFDEKIMGYKIQFNKLEQESIKKYAHVINVENSLCDYMRDAKNCQYCVDGYDAEDCKYAEHVRRNAKDVMDVSTVGRDANLIYESINTAINVHHCVGTIVVWNSINMYYCHTCFDCHDCFACVGLKQQSYCILNKQYTKEEYEKLVPKIIEKMKADGEWGEFFPISMSPFAYNETVAQEYFPLDKEQVLGKGYVRKEEEDRNYVGAQYDPLAIKKYKDEKNKTELLNSILKCEKSGRPFKIIKQELEFYIKNKISIPLKHPDIRHEERIKKRGNGKFFERECDYCGKNIFSIYDSHILHVCCENCRKI